MWLTLRWSSLFRFPRAVPSVSVGGSRSMVCKGWVLQQALFVLADTLTFRKLGKRVLSPIRRPLGKRTFSGNIHLRGKISVVLSCADQCPLAPTQGRQACFVVCHRAAYRCSYGPYAQLRNGSSCDAAASNRRGIVSLGVPRPTNFVDPHKCSDGPDSWAKSTGSEGEAREGLHRDV